MSQLLLRSCALERTAEHRLRRLRSGPAASGRRWCGSATTDRRLGCHGTRYARHARGWYAYGLRTVRGALGGTRSPYVQYGGPGTYVSAWEPTGASLRPSKRSRLLSTLSRRSVDGCERAGLHTTTIPMRGETEGARSTIMCCRARRRSLPTDRELQTCGFDPCWENHTRTDANSRSPAGSAEGVVCVKEKSCFFIAFHSCNCLKPLCKIIYRLLNDVRMRGRYGPFPAQAGWTRPGDLRWDAR